MTSYSGDEGYRDVPIGEPMTLAADAPWEAAMSDLLLGLNAPQGVQDRLLKPEDDPAVAAQREMLRTVLRAAANAGQAGPAALDTADWRDEDGPGNLRTDYVLPSRDLAVTASGVFWPAPGDPLAEAAATASAHRLVWVDLALP